MRGSKSRPDRRVRSLLLAALLSAAVCLASGAALATCTPSLAGISPGNGDVACYVKVQPIDVCTTTTTRSGTVTSCAPFNTTSTTGNWTTAGMPYQTISPPPGVPTMVPNNPTSPNPIGFTVDPMTGVSPPPTGDTKGVDITRALLNNIGVDLVWFPMTQYITPNAQEAQNLTTLNITPTSTPIANCKGYIAGFTLTITSSCTAIAGSSPTPAVTDVLAQSPSGTAITAGTVITGVITGVGGVGSAYTVNPSQTAGSAKSPIAITASITGLQSTDFQTLSQQVKSTSNPPSPPCAISQMTIPAGATVNGVVNNCGSPSSPRSTDASTINMFFVNTLNPPTSGGTLYGLSWIGNNGVAISGNTFFAPTPLQARPDTITHELLHDLGLDHDTYGAGPWAPPTNPNANPALSFYTSPFGVAPPIPTNPLFGECDSSYPACGANLMTAGSLRTEPTVMCVLAPENTSISSCYSNGVQLPSFLTGTADQVTPLNTKFGYGTATSAQLPTTQQQEVLSGMSGLLLSNNPPITLSNNAPIIPPPIQLSGLINPIPYETTKAQLGIGGSSSTDPIIFDLSGPAGGQPGETLVAWVLTLPEGETFARHGRFHVVSQSREDLVRDVSYYPNSGKNPLMKNIAYYSDLDNESDNPSARYNPCASPTVECLMVEFRGPGLRGHDSISFSEDIRKSILFSKPGSGRSGGAPITNDDLCRAKITYMFSDGFTTTSNFGHCTGISLPLIASSWRPDPHVAPHIIKPNKTNLLLAQMQSPGTSQAAPVIGYAYLNNCASGNAVIGFRQLSCQPPNLTPDVTFSVPSPNPACNGLLAGAFVGGTLCFNSNMPVASNPNGYTVGGFLATGGATILTPPSAALTAALAASLDNTVFEFTGTVTVSNGQSFQAGNDDGLQLMIGSNLVINDPLPQSYSGTPTTYTYPDTGPAGTLPFDLVYGECCGPPAVLGVSLPLESQTVSVPGTPVPGTTTLLFDLDETGPSDANSMVEGGQKKSLCSNGPSTGGPVTGTIPGNVTLPFGQQCTYGSPTQPCEFLGNLTITGGTASINNCQVDGNITVIAGSLSLANSEVSSGNINISQAASFMIGPQSRISGNLTIQSVLVPNPPGTGPYTVCSSHVNGNISVQSNTPAIQIGTGGPACTQGNTIGGSLSCSNNANVTSGGNTVGGHFQGQCSG
jgi:hypothetical protein